MLWPGLTKRSVSRRLRMLRDLLRMTAVVGLDARERHAVDLRPQEEDDPLGLADARERLAGKLASVVGLQDVGKEGLGLAQ